MIFEQSILSTYIGLSSWCASLAEVVNVRTILKWQMYMRHRIKRIKADVGFCILNMRAQYHPLQDHDFPRHVVMHFYLEDAVNAIVHSCTQSKIGMILEE